MTILRRHGHGKLKKQYFKKKSLYRLLELKVSYIGFMLFIYRLLIFEIQRTRQQNQQLESFTSNFIL